MGKGAVPPPMFPLRELGDTDTCESGVDAPSGVDDGEKGSDPKSAAGALGGARHASTNGTSTDSDDGGMMEFWGSRAAAASPTAASAPPATSPVVARCRSAALSAASLSLPLCRLCRLPPLQPRHLHLVVSGGCAGARARSRGASPRAVSACPAPTAAVGSGSSGPACMKLPLDIKIVKPCTSP